MGVWLYAGVVSAHLGGCFAQNKKLIHGTKLFLMPLLYMGLVVGQGYTLPTMALLGLILGYVGDLFMLKPQVEVLLILGMLTFGLGHVGYVVALLHGVPFQAADLLFSLAIGAIFGTIVYRTLLPHLPHNMRLPVLAYVVVILSMWVGAYSRLMAGLDKGWLTFWGGLLFILSDTILAFQLFKGETKYSCFCVMLFYISAQTLLVVGLRV